MLTDIIVLKFGSSVLRGRADLPSAVHEIYRWYRSGWRVVVVVSALGETTEQLLREARELAAEPQPNALAELLATGERHSAALLGIALDRAGVPARVVDPREIGLTVEGEALDSDPVDVNREQVEGLFIEYPVPVMPGFFGYSRAGHLHLLRRRGSDLSAVYLATALRANRCRLIKDVDGVYESDPAASIDGASARPRRYRALGYAEALAHAVAGLAAVHIEFIDRHVSGRAPKAAPAPMIGQQVLGDAKQHAPQLIGVVLPLIAQQPHVGFLRQIRGVLFIGQPRTQHAQQLCVVASRDGLDAVVHAFSVVDSDA